MITTGGVTGCCCWAMAPDGIETVHLSLDGYGLGVAHYGVRRPDLGRRLKEHQRQMVRELGADVIYWTYDPLVARNAHLNFNRLGVRVAEYVVLNSVTLRFSRRSKGDASASILA